MKIIYIATAVSETGDTIQENAYTDAQLALDQAVKMCNDIKLNTGMNATPDAMPMELFEKGDKLSETISG